MLVLLHTDPEQQVPSTGMQAFLTSASLQARAGAAAGAGAASAGGGSDTERSSSRELASPRKCDRMVFAEACSWSQMTKFSSSSAVM